MPFWFAPAADKYSHRTCGGLVYMNLSACVYGGGRMGTNVFIHAIYT